MNNKTEYNHPRARLYKFCGVGCHYVYAESLKELEEDIRNISIPFKKGYFYECVYQCTNDGIFSNSSLKEKTVNFGYADYGISHTAYTSTNIRGKDFFIPIYKTNSLF